MIEIGDIISVRAQVIGIRIYRNLGSKLIETQYDVIPLDHSGNPNTNNLKSFYSNEVRLHEPKK